MGENEVERVAPRISVLDANEVDNVIYNVFKSQADYISKWLPPWIINHIGPEVIAVLKIVIWKMSIDKSKATFGQQLLHLKYSNDSQLWKLRALGFLMIGVPYIRERILNIVFNSDNSRKVNRILDRIETINKALNVIILINFLRRGGPPTFIEYILNLKPVSIIPTSKRNVGYSYLTRELVWHGFIELLGIIIPFINYSKLKNRITKFFKRTPSLSYTKATKCSFTSSSRCAVCQESPILPHEMGCSHCFCYICLATNRKADITFECPECGFSNPEKTAMRPVRINI